MKFKNIELEVGQEWRTTMDSKFGGMRVIISKIEDNEVQCTINNMLFDERNHIIKESEVSYLHSIA